jgi:hypothetical protein
VRVPEGGAGTRPAASVPPPVAFVPAPWWVRADGLSPAIVGTVGWTFEFALQLHDVLDPRWTTGRLHVVPLVLFGILAVGLVPSVVHHTRARRYRF